MKVVNMLELFSDTPKFPDKSFYVPTRYIGSLQQLL